MKQDCPTIALTGATGFVGSAAINAALAQGYHVRALTRREQPARDGVSWVMGELTDPASLERLVQGSDAILHIAGVVNAPDAAGFELGNVTGTLNLVHAAVRAGVRRFVLVSSLSAREPDLSDYGASKARGETVVKASSLDWTIVRPPAIYGPRDKEMFELFRSARWGIVPIPKDGRSSLIHVQDLADLLVALLPADDRTSGRTYEPDDGRAEGWSHFETARAIGWAMGRRPWVVGLSRRMLNFAAGADHFLRGTKAKMTRDRAAYFSHPDWVASAHAAVPHGLWAPRIETREGLRATAQWYRAEKWL